MKGKMPLLGAPPVQSPLPLVLHKTPPPQTQDSNHDYEPKSHGPGDAMSPLIYLPNFFCVCLDFYFVFFQPRWSGI